jgi:hypothetical protein
MNAYLCWYWGTRQDRSALAILAPSMVNAAQPISVLITGLPTQIFLISRATRVGCLSLPLWSIYAESNTPTAPTKAVGEAPLCRSFRFSHRRSNRLPTVQLHPQLPLQRWQAQRRPAFNRHLQCRHPCASLPSSSSSPFSSFCSHSILMLNSFSTGMAHCFRPCRRRSHYHSRHLSQEENGHLVQPDRWHFASPHLHLHRVRLIHRRPRRSCRHRQLL